jgi:D-amino-acid dehydrogenase
VQVDDPDVLVIGGGVIGLCSAYYAIKAGRRVVLVERGEIGSGCSRGNAGWLVPSHCIPLAAPGAVKKALRWMWSSRSPFSIRPRLDWNLVCWLIAFASACDERKARASIPLLRDLTFASLGEFQELATSVEMGFGFQRKGSLMLYATGTGLSEGKRDADMLSDNGIASQPWSREEILHREPEITARIAGGIFYPDDHQIVPSDFTETLARTCRRLGASVLPGTAVTGFQVSNGTISSVRTTQGDFRPGTVILAAGAESPGLAAQLGIHLPIEAGKGYSFSVPTSMLCLSRPILLSEAKVAVTPFDDKVRFAGTLELSGIDYRINLRKLEVIRENSSSYFSAKLPEVMNEAWSGLRPCTPDGLPIISNVPHIDNLVIASGHAMLGVSLAPISGKLAAQLACEASTDFDLSLLTLSRFNH